MPWSQHLPKPLYLRNHLLRFRTTTPAHARPSSSQIRPLTSQINPLPLPRRKAAHFPPAMRTAGVTSPESDAPVPEDFVHVRNPNDSQISSDESNQNPNPSAKSSSASSSDAIDDDAFETSGRDDFDAVGDSAAVQAVDLPEEISKGVVLLECESTAESGNCRVYLVGTAHVSEVLLFDPISILSLVYAKWSGSCGVFRCQLEFPVANWVRNGLLMPELKFCVLIRISCCELGSELLVNVGIEIGPVILLLISLSVGISCCLLFFSVG